MLYNDDNDWMIWIQLDRKQIDAYMMIFSKTDWKTLENWLRCWENRVFPTFCDALLLRDSRLVRSQSVKIHRFVEHVKQDNKIDHDDSSELRSEKTQSAV